MISDRNIGLALFGGLAIMALLTLLCLAWRFQAVLDALGP